MRDYLQSILDEVELERKYQDHHWGADFDVKNSLDNWIAYITTYCGMAAIQQSPADQREKMLKVAALAVAACEAFDRNNSFPPRHYDRGKLV